MSTTFHVPENGATSTLASPRTAGGTSLTLVDGSTFGTVFPKIVTVIRAGTVLCILEATARAGNVLTVTGTAIENTTDANMIVGDTVEMRPTKLAMTEIHASVNALETAPEVSVTGATTLTTAASGKVHVISGSSTFALTFPTAVGYTGSPITVRCATGYTGLVTLTGNSGQTFAGIAGLVMYAKESATWKSDGSNWVRVGGTGPIPMLCSLHLSTIQGIANTVSTKVLLDATDVDNSGLMADLANSRITVARAGTYRLALTIVWAGPTAAGVRFIGQAYLNGVGTPCVAELPIYAAGSFASLSGTKMLNLAAGDHIELDAYQNSGASQAVLGSSNTACSLEIEEIPAW